MSTIQALKYRKLYIAMAYYIYTVPHYVFLKKNSRPDISTLTAYEITVTAILKHVFHETKHEEV